MNFLEATIRETKILHDKILNTPRGRVTKKIKEDIESFIDYCGWLLRGGKSQRNTTIKL